MSLIVLIIFLTGLWVSFGLPRLLSKIERPTMKLDEIDLEVKLKFEQPSLPATGPDFYDYYDEDGQITRADRGSVMYMLIYESLSRRR